MKRLSAIAIAVFALLTSACNTWVSPGYAGIKVVASGSQRGVQDFPVVTGRVWYNPYNESVFEYPTFVQTAVWSKSQTEGNPSNEEITFTTADKMPVSADISIAYRLEHDKVPAFYVKFRSDDIYKFTHGYLRNLARQTFDDIGGKYKIDAIMGDNAVYLTEVRSKLQLALAPDGVMLEQLGFIGAPRPPQGVTDSINASTQATQNAIKIENELRSTEASNKKLVSAAEAQARAIVLEAEGQATANRKLADSITPTLVEYQRTLKWDGKLPQVTSSGGTLFQLK